MLTKPRDPGRLIDGAAHCLHSRFEREADKRTVDAWPRAASGLGHFRQHALNQLGIAIDAAWL